MSARIRTLPPAVHATLKRATLPCMRSEMAAALAGFAAWPLDRPAQRVAGR